MRHLCAACCFAFGGLVLAQDIPSGEEPPPAGEYTGPAILSRGGIPAVGPGDEFMQIRPFVTILGVYDTGLTAVATDEFGRIPDANAYGAQAMFGAVGYHSWKHTTLSLDYRGSFRHYSRQTYYDGMDNALALSLDHRLSRRVAFNLTQSAASYRGGFYGLSGFRFHDPSFTNLAENTIFDARTHVLLSTGRLIFQKSPRLSFSASGTGTLLEPRSQALVGIRGVRAAGDVAYRVSRFQTIGTDYTFDHYSFPGAFGSANIHGIGLNYGVQLGRRWTMSLRAGAYRVETQRLQRVRIDPFIAAILGQTTGVEAFHRVLYVPGLGASLTRSFRRATLSMNYTRGISPGNGLYLTSGHESVSVGLGYTGTRRWHFAASIGYSRFSSFSQTLGRYFSYHAGGGATYRLHRFVGLSARIDGRKYNLEGTGFGRTYYRASAGLVFSPGDFPVSIW